MQVPLLDLKPQYQPLKSEIHAAIEKVCASQALHPRPERQGARSGGGRSTASAAIGIGVSSGTDALLVALMALEIGAGDEVITSPYTFFATAGTIARVGRAAGVLRHRSGHVQSFARGGEAFIETQLRATRRRARQPRHRRRDQGADAGASVRSGGGHGRVRARSRGATACGSSKMRRRPSARRMRAGGAPCSFGDIGCLSFFPTKNLGAFGDAGMCVTNDAGARASAWMILRVHGGKPKYYHAFIGGNFRLDEMQAAVLNVKLQASRCVERRRASATPRSTTGLRARGSGQGGRDTAARCGRRAAHLQPVRDPRRAIATAAPASDGSGRRHRDLLSGAAAPAAVLRVPGLRRAATSRSPSAPRRRRWRCRSIPSSTKRQLQYVVDISRGLLPALSMTSADRARPTYRRLEAARSSCATPRTACHTRELVRAAIRQRASRASHAKRRVCCSITRASSVDEARWPRCPSSPMRSSLRERIEAMWRGEHDQRDRRPRRYCTSRCASRAAAASAAPEIEKRGAGRARAHARVRRERAQRRNRRQLDEALHPGREHRHRRLGPRARDGGARRCDRSRGGAPARASSFPTSTAAGSRTCSRRGSGTHAVHHLLEDIHHARDADQCAHARARGWQASWASRRCRRISRPCRSTRQAMDEFGVHPDYRFQMWDWVGGRYSMWSSIGVSLAIAIGREQFPRVPARRRTRWTSTSAARRGGRTCRRCMALLGRLEHQFPRSADARGAALRRPAARAFPRTCSSSRWKATASRCTRAASPCTADTAPVIWGEPGNNAQHSFFQLLHQGTPRAALDFLLPAKSSCGNQAQQDLAIANCLAQAEAFMAGQSRARGLDRPHRIYPGDRPSSIVVSRSSILRRSAG